MGMQQVRLMFTQPPTDSMSSGEVTQLSNYSRLRQRYDSHAGNLVVIYCQNRHFVSQFGKSACPPLGVNILGIR
jgi:hypothetical protein